MAVHATVDYVMPLLSSNHTATEVRCFLHGPCRDVINRTVSEELVGELDNQWGSVIVSCCSYKLAAEARDSSGTQRKGNVHHWMSLPDDW
jgi:hypothetical protein